MDLAASEHIDGGATCRTSFIVNQKNEAHWWGIYKYNQRKDRQELRAPQSQYNRKGVVTLLNRGPDLPNRMSYFLHFFWIVARGYVFLP